MKRKISNKLITKNTPLREVLKLAAPCRCNACENGCKLGSGFLIGEDVKNIAKFLNIEEEELKQKYLEATEQFNTKLLRPRLIRKGNKPYGRCIFFDDKKGCKIHPVKPLQCKTSIACKDYGERLSLWFMLNYIVNEKNIEFKKIKKFFSFGKEFFK